MKTETTTPSTNSKAHARAIVRATLATRQAQAELDKAQAELLAAETAARADGFTAAVITYRGASYSVNTGTTGGNCPRRYFIRPRTKDDRT